MSEKYHTQIYEVLHDKNNEVMRTNETSVTSSSSPVTQLRRISFLPRPSDGPTDTLILDVMRPGSRVASFHGDQIPAQFDP